MTVIIGAQGREGATSMRDLRPCNAGRRSVGVSDNRDRPSGDRLFNEAIPVARFAAHRHEHIAWLHATRIVLDPRYFWISAPGRDVSSFQQLKKVHCK